MFHYIHFYTILVTLFNFVSFFLFHFILFHFISFHSISFHFLFHSILFHSVSFHFILFYPILFHCILFSPWNLSRKHLLILWITMFLDKSEKKIKFQLLWIGCFRSFLEPPEANSTYTVSVDTDRKAAAIWL